MPGVHATLGHSRVYIHSTNIPLNHHLADMAAKSLANHEHKTDATTTAWMLTIHALEYSLKV